MGFEVCQLVFMQHPKREERCWWEARQATLQGEIVICRSPEYIDAHTDANRTQIGVFLTTLRSMQYTVQLIEKSQEQKRAAHANVIAQLTVEGWEPAGTDQNGFISVMKRVKQSEATAG